MTAWQICITMQVLCTVGLCWAMYKNELPMIVLLSVFSVGFMLASNQVLQLEALKTIEARIKQLENRQ